MTSDHLIPADYWTGHGDETNPPSDGGGSWIVKCRWRPVSECLLTVEESTRRRISQDRVSASALSLTPWHQSSDQSGSHFFSGTEVTFFFCLDAPKKKQQHRQQQTDYPEDHKKNHKFAEKCNIEKELEVLLIPNRFPGESHVIRPCFVSFPKLERPLQGHVTVSQQAAD